MPDKIHLTVATFIERENHFLLVRGIRDGREVLNQLSGHVELGEIVVDTAIRETLEETACHIKPAGAISFSSYKTATNDVTHYRRALAEGAVEFDDPATMDSDIEEAVDDYRAKVIYPLDLLKTHR
ncbi:MAG: ADP-ribose pyrophosphatase YjhB (NUDIX family) [Porticoccus sp.]